jgi:hypothetical protein
MAKIYASGGKIANRDGAHDSRAPRILYFAEQ